MNRFVQRLVVAMLCGVLVYGAFALYTGLEKMQASLRDFAWSSFGVALLLATANYLVRFLKWQYYLGRLGIRGIGWLDSLLVFLSGFVLTITPGKVGEVFKSAVLARTHGVAVERTAPIVVAERLTDAIGVIALIVLGSSAFEGGRSWAVAGVVAVSIGLLAILWQRPVELVFSWLEQRSERTARAVPKLRQAYQSLRVVAGPAALLIPTCLSIVAWAAEGLAMWVILRGFHENLPLGRAIFFYSTATLAGALVPLPGGLGVVEGMIREQLVHLNHVADGTATAAMILIRFATLWWAVVVGFLALGALRLRFGAKLATPVELQAPSEPAAP
jgi:glycosyltransferase 2 family protein